MKKTIFYFLLLVLTVFLSRDLIFSGSFPDTHDGQNHLARLANYYLAVKSGQIPPRVAPNLEAGLGYPVLNFNYPLPNLLALPLIVFNLSVETSLKILFFGSLLMAGFGMYRLLSLRYSPLSSFLGSASYLVVPYQLQNIFVRGNIGESLALALLPWVIYLALVSSQKPQLAPRYIVVATAFLLSHNLMAVLSLPVIAVLYLVSVRPASRRRIILPSFIALLLSCFFWIPALMEKAWIVLDSSPLSLNQLVYHFVSLRQLISSAWDHGYSYPFPVDGLGFGVGLTAWLGALTFLPIWLKTPQKSRYWFETLAWLGFGLAIFGMLAISRPVWQLVPYLSIIQFPWRLLFFAAFFSAIMVAFVTDFWSRWPVIIALFIVISGYASGPLGINYFHHPDDYWFTFPLNTTILNENDPIWYRRTEALALLDQTSDRPIIIGASGSAKIDSWNGKTHRYSLLVEDDAQIIEPTLYFPGWVVSVDGQSVELSAHAGRFTGLLNYDLPAGEHTIVSRFTQNTPARILGNSLTLIGFGILIYQIRKSRS